MRSCCRRSRRATPSSPRPGIYGTVKRVEESIVVVEIAKGVTMKIAAAPSSEIIRDRAEARAVGSGRAARGKSAPAEIEEAADESDADDDAVDEDATDADRPTSDEASREELTAGSDIARGGRIDVSRAAVRCSGSRNRNSFGQEGALLSRVKRDAGILVLVAILLGVFAWLAFPLGRRPISVSTSRAAWRSSWRRSPPTTQPPRPNKMDQAVKIIQDRVNKLGVAEPEIQRQGERQDQRPASRASTTPSRRWQIIGKTAVLEFFDVKHFGTRLRQPRRTP